MNGSKVLQKIHKWNLMTFIVFYFEKNKILHFCRKKKENFKKNVERSAI